MRAAQIERQLEAVQREGLPASYETGIRNAREGGHAAAYAFGLCRYANDMQQVEAIHRLYDAVMDERALS